MQFKQMFVTAVCVSFLLSTIYSRYCSAMSCISRPKEPIGVRLTMPSSPHEFFKVFLQKIRICVTFHLFQFIFCNRPVAFGVLGMDTGEWIHKIYRVIHSLVIETQDPLHSPVSRPFICINQRAWLHVSLNNRQKRSSISPSD